MKEKNRYILLFLALLIGLIGLFAIQTFINNEELKSEIEARDKTIKDLMVNDSIYSSKTKEYSQVLTKYINNCNFYLGDKEVSTSEIVSLTNKLLNENQKLLDSLLYYKELNKYESSLNTNIESEYLKSADSLHTVNAILNLIKRDFGIKYTVKREGENKIITRAPTKIDSAIILYPHFKEMLSYDSISKNWTIKIPTIRETIIVPKEKEKKKRN